MPPKRTKQQKIEDLKPKRKYVKKPLDEEAKQFKDQVTMLRELRKENKKQQKTMLRLQAKIGFNERMIQHHQRYEQMRNIIIQKQIIRYTAIQYLRAQGVERQRQESENLFRS